MTVRRHAGIWFERAGHSAAAALAVTGAFLLRFDFAIPREAVPVLKHALVIALLVKLPIFDLAGFYRCLRRFASIRDV